MSQFTPVTIFEGNERDWPYQLGVLDWDDTRIVFTKRELLNFLKYMGTSVDPNFNNISKLPKYATFAKVEGNLPRPGGSDAFGAGGGSSSVSSDFVPTRRVREAPGGKSSISFYDEEEQDDALASAPSSKSIAESTANVTATNTTDTPTTEEPVGLPASNIVPSRRVRDPPGGKDSLKSLWDAPTEEEFKPTRRVQDNVGNFY